MGFPLLCHALCYRQQLYDLGRLLLNFVMELGVDRRTPTQDDTGCRSVMFVCIHGKAVQAGRLGQERVEIVVDAAQEDSVDGGATPRWRSAAAIDGKSYSWVHTCNAKFMAKREAAAMLLKELLPGEHRGERGMGSAVMSRSALLLLIRK